MEDHLIAVVDDEQDIRELVGHHLKREGYDVKTFESGRDFLFFIKTTLPDLVVLDIMLPGVDGLELCKSLKQSSRTASLPVMLLTAKGTEADIVLGLELGADDYVVKPFSPRELVARVKSILRRTYERAEDDTTVTVGPLTIDSEQYEAKIDGKKMTLTTTEFKILEVLARSRGKVFTRDQLIKQKRIWGDSKLIYDRTIDVHIKNLRDKMGAQGSMIATVRGVGYKIEA